MTLDEALEKMWEDTVDNRAYSETLFEIALYVVELFPELKDYVRMYRQQGKELQKISPYLYLKE